MASTLISLTLNIIINYINKRTVHLVQEAAILCDLKTMLHSIFIKSIKHKTGSLSFAKPILHSFYSTYQLQIKKSKNQQLHVNLAFWCLHDTIVKVMKNKEYKFSALPVIITLMKECTVWGPKWLLMQHQTLLVFPNWEGNLRQSG